jgi:hypothetical protein
MREKTMQNTAMNFDIKALLTLLLLKQGTSSKDIQTAVNLTAAARLMVAEEYAELAPSEDAPEAGNVTKIRPARRCEADTVADARRFEPHADAMNSDIKALLMLLLLQNGASSREIQTTLRLAARSRGLMADEQAEEPAEEIAIVAVSKVQEARAMSPKQALRSDQLAPISMREFAA